MGDLVPIEPWAKREGEREHEYAWFKAYVELGDARTPARAAARCGVATQQVKAAATQHDWSARAAAYDRACVAVAETIAPDEAESLAMQYAAGVAMMRLGVTAIQLKNPSLLRVKDVKELMLHGAEMARRGAGVADLKVEADVVTRVENMVNDLLGD